MLIFNTEAAECAEKHRLGTSVLSVNSVFKMGLVGFA